MNSSIELNSIETLKSGKNLLAFSGGVDSSALFFLLIEHKIEFDIALVNYQVRKESILEERFIGQILFRQKRKLLTIFRQHLPIKKGFPSILIKANFWRKIGLGRNFRITSIISGKFHLGKGFTLFQILNLPGNIQLKIGTQG